jgi:translation initiation factor IF-3
MDRDLVNERIHFKEVQLVGPEGENIGIVPIRVALQKSMDMQLDLLCVSPQAQPPVCRIVNYGKFKFEKDKKAKDMKKNQKKTVLKEVRFSATTDVHDLETKAKAAVKFLGEGMKVKAVVFIKGRMRSRMDIVEEKLKQFLDLVGEHGTIEKAPELLGKDYFVMINPKNTKKQEGQKNA